MKRFEVYLLIKSIKKHHVWKLLQMNLFLILSCFPACMALLRAPSSVVSFKSTALHMRKYRKESHRGFKSTESRQSGHKNMYAPVGYNRGDLTTLKTMFDENAESGLLSYDSLIESRYLRFWPGRTSDAESIWSTILGSKEKRCSFKEMVEIQNVLDQIAFTIEFEMEQERIQWSLDDLNYENMINYFHDVMNEESQLLSFNNFMKWEFIQAELWFHDDRGLTKSKLADMWCQCVGSISCGVNFNQFNSLYNKVCDFKYQVH